jgi:hypothetical protein
MTLRKTYFCGKCKHLHVFNSGIGRKHIAYNTERKERFMLDRWDKWGVIK